MTTRQSETLDPMNLVRELTALPHRAATSVHERSAAAMLERRLKELGATVERQRFMTPPTYVTEVWWLLLGLILGLRFLPTLPWGALLLVIASVALAFHYFDWRASPVSRLPPRAEAVNVIGRKAPSTKAQRKLILMAHYDSAPVSFLYRPERVKGFRQSLRMSMAVMVLAVVVSVLYVLGIATTWMNLARWALVIYFLLQGALSTIDYLRLGFTNGAADNATGTAAALVTAARLWEDPLPDWEVDLVLTSAEEANMKGSLAYYQANAQYLDRDKVFLLNLGAGDIKVVTRTGSLTNVDYDNPLVDAALAVVANDARFAGVKPGVWHTGDFDSIWFARAGIPSMTLSAQDAQGRIPNLHRPSDVLQNVDAAVPMLAVELAEAIVRRLASQLRTDQAVAQ